jgi:glycosyltransferase involved in cell wall biosynthesis
MKLLIIRGDLQSHSGYSAAARDYCQQLRGLFDRVVGVDIHHASDRPFEHFPYPLALEAEARGLTGSAESALVLSFTTPDHYAQYPRAVNVGLTFWETDRLPWQGEAVSGWVDHANAMDALWLPSTNTKRVFEKAGVSVPIRVIPWPIQIPNRVSPGLPDGEVYKLDRDSPVSAVLARVGSFREDRFRWTRWATRALGRRAQGVFLQRLRISARKLARPPKRTFLCVAQDVPRKGLLLLLSEWMEFKRHEQAARWRLILKTTPIDPQKPRFDFVLRFWWQVHALKYQLRLPRADVTLWTGDLSDAEFHRLVANTDAHVAPSLGEGFCGPAALALGLGKPLVAPRHTAFADYLPGDYRYCFESRPVHLRFVNDPLDVYDPASTWNVPEPFALAAALRRLASDSPERQSEACWRACAHFNHWCSPQRVRATLCEEVQTLLANTRRSAAA